MISGKALLAVSLVVVAHGASAAQPSPYAGWQERSIKGLSAQQIEDYLEGRGMSLALAAELNGYPGPRHVLDLADKLDLTPDQLARTQKLFDDMRLKAGELGQAIVEREAILDELFASGTASAAALYDVTAALGRLNGELRAHHLSYHLPMRDILEPRQVQTYRRLRGDAAPGGPGEHRPDDHRRGQR